MKITKKHILAVAAIILAQWLSVYAVADDMPVNACRKMAKSSPDSESGINFKTYASRCYHDSSSEGCGNIFFIPTDEGNVPPNNWRYKITRGAGNYSVEVEGFMHTLSYKVSGGGRSKPKPPEFEVKIGGMEFNNDKDKFCTYTEEGDTGMMMKKCELINFLSDGADETFKASFIMKDPTLKDCKVQVEPNLTIKDMLVPSSIVSNYLQIPVQFQINDSMTPIVLLPNTIDPFVGAKFYKYERDGGWGVAVELNSCIYGLPKAVDAEKGKFKEVEAEGSKVTVTLNHDPGPFLTSENFGIWRGECVGGKNSEGKYWIFTNKVDISNDFWFVATLTRNFDLQFPDQEVVFTSDVHNISELPTLSDSEVEYESSEHAVTSTIGDSEFVFGKNWVVNAETIDEQSGTIKTEIRVDMTGTPIPGEVYRLNKLSSDGTKMIEITDSLKSLENNCWKSPAKDCVGSTYGGGKSMQLIARVMSNKDEYKNLAIQVTRSVGGVTTSSDVLKICDMKSVIGLCLSVPAFTEELRNKELLGTGQINLGRIIDKIKDKTWEFGQTLSDFVIGGGKEETTTQETPGQVEEGVEFSETTGEITSDAEQATDRKTQVESPQGVAGGEKAEGIVSGCSLTSNAAGSGSLALFLISLALLPMTLVRRGAK